MADSSKGELSSLIGALHDVARVEALGVPIGVDREEARRRNLGQFSLTAEQRAQEGVDLRAPVAEDVEPPRPRRRSPRRRRSLLGL